MRSMPVDNEIFNRLGHTWWDENEVLSLLRTSLGDVRFGYFQQVLIERYKKDPGKTKVLDVGCGGGLLAEEFARLGCRVIGMDPSEPSLSTARRHAEQSNLRISYQSGIGEQIPFADASFDVVICCDVLEHVNDFQRVVHEIARVLVTGGIWFYDTINATFLSWLTVIKLAQEWKMTCLFPPNLHDWKHFIKPRQLESCMRQCYLANQEMKGISPHGNPFVFFSRFLRYKRGEITLAKVGLRFHESRNLSVLYMGHAFKQRCLNQERA